MSTRTMDGSTSNISPTQHEIADLLLVIAGHDLTKHAEKKSYITLDWQLGKSRNNKNAISVLRNKVIFMVEDFTLAERAKELGLQTAKKETPDQRLIFPALTPEMMRLNEPFFRQISLHAKAASGRRQASTVKNKALHRVPAHT